MEEVTDKKLIEKIKSKVNNETDISGLQEVTDLDLKSKILNLKKDQSEKGFFEGLGESVSNFFSGTKKLSLQNYQKLVNIKVKVLEK